MIFKQLITNLGIHCALKMSCCQSFCGFMYPLKMNHQNFTLEGTLKIYEWEPWDSGNIQHCTVHIIHHAILIITEQYSQIQINMMYFMI